MKVNGVILFILKKNLIQRHSFLTCVIHKTTKTKEKFEFFERLPGILINEER